MITNLEVNISFSKQFNEGLEILNIAPMKRLGQKINYFKIFIQDHFTTTEPKSHNSFVNKYMFIESE